METAFLQGCDDIKLSPPVLQAKGADFASGVQLDASQMASTEFNIWDTKYRKPKWVKVPTSLSTFGRKTTTIEFLVFTGKKAVGQIRSRLESDVL